MHEAPQAFRACGVRIDALTPEDAVQRIVARARTGAGGAVHLCNAYTLSLAERDAGFAALLDAGALNLMDGMPLVWTARRIGFRHCARRVYGPDLMLDVLGSPEGRGLRHHLYGSTPEVLEALTGRLRQRFPGVSIVGADAPPFGLLTGTSVDEAVDAFSRTGADIVWVGLGTPKQDLLVARAAARTDAVLVAVGAAFDFHAGLKRQAPRWMQDRGLEWTYRLATEPRRLWRRYLIGNVVFLRGLARGVTRVDRRERPQ